MTQAGEVDGPGFDAAGWRRGVERGLTSLPVATTWGGHAASLATTVAAFEHFGAEGHAFGPAFALGAQLWAVTRPIERFGSDGQRARWLPGLCAGDLVGAHAISEPSAGSDAFALATSAVRDGEGWILNGAKTFVSNAPVADVFVVFATVDPGLGWAGVTAFVVGRDNPGLTVSSTLRVASMAGAALAELTLDDCRVSADGVLGSRGSGLAVFTYAMNHERAFLLAPALGRVRAALRQCVAGERMARWRAGDALVEAEVAHLLLARTASRADVTRRFGDEGALTKLAISHAWTRAAALGVGGDPVTESLDAAASRIYSGTSEIQRDVLARRLGL